MADVPDFEERKYGERAFYATRARLDKDPTWRFAIPHYGRVRRQKQRLELKDASGREYYRVTPDAFPELCASLEGDVKLDPARARVYLVVIPIRETKINPELDFPDYNPFASLPLQDTRTGRRLLARCVDSEVRQGRSVALVALKL